MTTTSGNFDDIFASNFMVLGELPESEPFKIALKPSDKYAPLDLAVRHVIDLYCLTGLRAENTVLKNKSCGLTVGFDVPTLETSTNFVVIAQKTKAHHEVPKALQEVIAALQHNEAFLESFDSLDCMSHGQDSKAVDNFLGTGLNSWEVADLLAKVGKDAISSGFNAIETATSYFRLGYTFRNWGSEIAVHCD